MLTKHFEYFGINEINKNPIPQIDISKKDYDVCYYGRNRKERMPVLKEILDTEELSKEFIGKDLPKYKNTTVHSAVPREVLKQYIGKSWVSVIIMDPAHANNVMTFRYFENAMYGIFSCIYLPHDKHMRLIKDEELRKYSYFSNTKELIDIVDWFKNNPESYEDMVMKQRKCKIEYLNTWNS
jgi:hypothetical protein